MSDTIWKEPLTEQRVTHAVMTDNGAVVLENVPARVNTDTGERLFSPETVRKIEGVLRGRPRPSRTVETPVYELA